MERDFEEWRKSSSYMPFNAENIGNLCHGKEPLFWNAGHCVPEFMAGNKWLPAPP